MTTVFVSYRREDTAGEARALFNELSTKLGKDSVFMDVDNIALERDFFQIRSNSRRPWPDAYELPAFANVLLPFERGNN